MNPADQAAAKVASAPLELRLSLSFCPAGQRSAQTALHAVYLELHEIPREVRDPGVADVKLRWWEEEIGLLYAGKARHPLTQTLQPHMPALKGMDSLFRDLVLGTRMDIAGAGFASFEDVKRYCFRRYGALAELSAALGEAHTEETRLAARLLGNATCLADISAHGVAQAMHGRLRFAAEDLKLHGVDRHINGDTHGSAQVQALVQDYGDRARAMRASALMGVPVSERTALTVWRVRCALALKRALKQERAGIAHAAEPVELQPLSALFTAWRAARQSG
ncbi:MAG TPA: squalene/phytoene synthase family protein [Gammaproteobacteria bacterium]|jgi:phytoene synthase